MLWGRISLLCVLGINFEDSTAALRLCAGTAAGCFKPRLQLEQRLKQKEDLKKISKKEKKEKKSVSIVREGARSQLQTEPPGW